MWFVFRQYLDPHVSHFFNFCKIRQKERLFNRELLLLCIISLNIFYCQLLYSNGVGSQVHTALYIIMG